MKNKRNIIIVGVVIALLVIGIFVINGIDTEKKEPIGTGMQTNTVYSSEASDLAEIKVVTENGEIRAVNAGKSDWTINDLPSDEIDPQKAYSLAGTVSTIISKNRFEADDLSQFGLDNPNITVTITKKNGETDTFYVGDMSPTLGEYFIMLDGDDSVYTLYSYKVDALLKPLDYYKEFDRFNVDIDDITDIRIERADGVIELRLKDKDSQNMANVWEMAEPFQSSANDDYIDNKILVPIENISLTEPVQGTFTGEPATLILTIKPFNNETGKYGKEYTETLEIGDTEGSRTYVYYNGSLYTTPAESVEFVNDNAFNIVSKLQALVDISLVKSVDVEYGNETHTIGITKESGSKYSFMLDGKETDSQVSQEIYRNMIGLAVDSVYNGGEVNDILLKLTYNGISNADTTIIEIKQTDDLNCVLNRNGKTEFMIKKSKIDEFITLFNAYIEANK